MWLFVVSVGVGGAAGELSEPKRERFRVSKATGCRIEHAADGLQGVVVDGVFAVRPQVALRGGSGANHRERRAGRLLKVVRRMAMSVQPEVDAPRMRDFEQRVE